MTFREEMDGCLGGERVRRHPFVWKSFLEVALISIQIALNLPTTYAQSGFVSIDCGGAQASYVDGNNLTWVTDNGTYMSLGKTIQQPSAVVTSQALRSFRYFPEGRSKYCYELNISNYGHPYLVRASFFINASLLNTTQFLEPFEFTLSIGATTWFTVSGGDENQKSVLVVQEGIFSPPGEVMNVCLQPVVGFPFISALELRYINESVYVYDGSNTQFLSVAFRYNIGAIPSTPDVRYPDDIFDRLWTTPDASWGAQCPNLSLADAPDTSISNTSLYVPPKVMKDAWIFQHGPCIGPVNFPVYVNGPIYITPASIFFVTAYIEHLNVSDTEIYTEAVSFGNYESAPSGDFSQKAYAIHQNYVILSTNNISFNPTMVYVGEDYPDIQGGPSLNAVEVLGQYYYNFSTTNSYDVEVITAMKTGFSLIDWQGDPCTPVPHDWLSCKLSMPIFGNLKQPCRTDGSSVGVCSGPTADLEPTYYITSINLSSRTTDGFSALALPEYPLQRVDEMSITNCGVDSAPLAFLISCASPTLSKLDLSYNVIDKIPPASGWANFYNLTSLNLAHNNLTGVLSPFEDVPFFNTLEKLDLSNNGMTSFPSKWTNTTKNLVTLDLSHNQFQGKISSLDEWVQINNQSLLSLDISNNLLSGTFSSDLYFSGLPMLASANFDHNSIQGVLNLSTWYDILQESVNAYHKRLSVSNFTSDATHLLISFVGNNISDISPSAKDFDSTIRSLLQYANRSFANKGVLLGGNPYCKSPTSYTQKYLCRSSIDDPIEDPRKHSKSKLILIISICSGVGVLLFFCVVLATLWNLWKQVYALREIQQALADRKVQPPFYQYNDLKLATRDFHNDNKLGHGGFGIVYKGVLPDKTTLAVKRLFNSYRVQVLDEFLNEVVLMTGIKHRNLVQMKGCCIKDKQRMLVYEYAEKGNLAEALWGGKAYERLNWEQRCKICVGVACGISYLHEELQPSIIHRDIKPENILLDKNFNPKIADFGLARHILDDASQARSTKNAGTLGYYAPEYVMQGQLSDKIDVYSYGILILEIVSGRKCIDPLRPVEEKFLIDWVGRMRKKNLLFNVLQPELRENCVMEEVIKTIHIGLLCAQHQPERRPTMSQVVTMFLGSMDIKGFSTEYDDTAQHILNTLLETIDDGTEYPTLQSIDEDSTVFPLLDLESSSSPSMFNTSHGSSSKPQIELGSFNSQ